MVAVATERCWLPASCTEGPWCGQAAPVPSIPVALAPVPRLPCQAAPWAFGAASFSPVTDDFLGERMAVAVEVIIVAICRGSTACQESTRVCSGQSDSPMLCANTKSGVNWRLVEMLERRSWLPTGLGPCLPCSSWDAISWLHVGCQDGVQQKRRVL